MISQRDIIVFPWKTMIVLLLFEYFCLNPFVWILLFYGFKQQTTKQQRTTIIVGSKGSNRDIPLGYNCFPEVFLTKIIFLFKVFQSKTYLSFKKYGQKGTLGQVRKLVSLPVPTGQIRKLVFLLVFTGQVRKPWFDPLDPTIVGSKGSNHDLPESLFYVFVRDNCWISDKNCGTG